MEEVGGGRLEILTESRKVLGLLLDFLETVSNSVGLHLDLEDLQFWSEVAMESS